MNWSLENILAIAIVVTGVASLVDILWLEKARLAKVPPASQPKWIEMSRSFFPILLIVFLLRAFLVEPFRIPTGSLEPSLLIGDFVLTNKYTYGIRLPIMHTKIIAIGTPKRGDIAVFRWPLDTRVDYIKRVVGLPGDHVEYHDKVLVINGQLAPQTWQANVPDEHGDILEKHVEDLAGTKHSIYVKLNQPSQDFDIVVPQGNYFVMGDNRDNSSDSRYWGFVPEQNLIGKAFMVWMSWDKQQHKVRWERLGMRIKSLV